MGLAPGTRFGSYAVVSAIGAGGMGEVYRARDLKLGRDIALKVLPAELAGDPERRTRFDREARALATLNHPNIAHIYGVEDRSASDDAGMTDGQRAIVMELVPGRTLAERLSSGPLPLPEALAVGRQIADALGAAHDRHIVHRDLKPANIKILPDGRVKVLDFGLAKALFEDADAESTDQVVTHSGTGTPLGTIIGTPAYMSPEQARGQGVDRRTDIFAFGCVLFELLAGRRAFDRPTATDTLAAVIERDPDWNALPPSTPERVRSLLRRCLQKDPRVRARDAGDLALEIGEIKEALSGPAESSAPSRRGGWRTAVSVVLAVMALAGVAAIALALKGANAPPVGTPLMHAAVVLPDGDRMLTGACPMMALSRDGRQLAFIARHGGKNAVYIRPLDNAEARAVPGTEDATDTVFFSPDGAWLGFFTARELKKVPTSGGSPVTIAVTRGCGADWSDDGRIIVGRLDGIFEMPRSAAGAPTQLVGLDASRSEVGLLFPQFLPGNRAVLATAVTNAGPSVIAHRVGTDDRRTLVENAANARYVAGGFLIYGSGGRLLAAPFDVETLELTGASVPVVDGVAYLTAGGPQFAVAGSAAAFAYLRGGRLDAQQAPVWVDRRGSVESLKVEPNRYSNPRLSPDGRLLALVKIDAGSSDVWIYDVARGGSIRLIQAGESRAPLWSPDGTRLAYASFADNDAKIMLTAADGSGTPSRLTASEQGSAFVPSSWSPDGTRLAVTILSESESSRIATLPVDGKSPLQPLVQTRAAASAGRFSPDAQWVAYVSNDSGRNEVYVRPFGRPGGPSQVSVGGGTEPVWARSGLELFYRSDARMMAVRIVSPSPLRLRAPQRLFEGAYAQGGDANYDVAADGRFLMLKAGEPPPPITIINVKVGSSGSQVLGFPGSGSK